MRIYLDLCCIKRPFDDQTQVRIRLETEAVDAFLTYCKAGVHELVSSEALDFENSRNPNLERKEFAESILAMAHTKIPHSAAIANRAKDWTAVGVSLINAYHLATAEAAVVDYFVTSDDPLRQRAARIPSTFRIVSPLELIQELSP